MSSITKPKIAISACLLVICALVLGSMMLPALRRKKDEAIAE